MPDSSTPKRSPGPRKAPLLFARPPRPKPETFGNRLWFWYGRWGAFISIIAGSLGLIATAFGLIVTSSNFAAAEATRAKERIAEARKAVETQVIYRNDLGPDLQRYLSEAGTLTDFNLACDRTKGACDTLSIAYMGTGWFRGTPTIVNVQLKDIEVHGMNVAGSDVSYFTMTQGAIFESRLEGCRLNQVKFDDVAFYDMTFDGCDVEGGLSFANSRLDGLTMTNSKARDWIDVSGAAFCLGNDTDPDAETFCAKLDDAIVYRLAWDNGKAPTGLHLLDTTMVPEYCKMVDETPCDELRQRIEARTAAP